MKRLLVALCASALTTSVAADLADSLDQLVGYTIIHSARVSGWYDDQGKGAEEFDGCEYGRTIVFDNNKTLTCAGYHYHYAYRPLAIVLVKGSEFKMIIADDVYDMRR
jgi:hypothetical protein